MATTMQRSHRWTKPADKLSDAGIKRGEAMQPGDAGLIKPNATVRGTTGASRYSAKTVVKRGV